MNKLFKVKFSGTTDASGDLVITSTSRYRGKVVALYVEVGTWAATTDVVVTGGDSGHTVATITNATASNAVVAGEASGFLFDEKIVVTVAQGGNTLTGDAYVLIE